MTIDETNLLHQKARSKKDGVYSFLGNLWAVKSNKFLAFCNDRIVTVSIAYQLTFPRLAKVAILTKNADAENEC